MKRQSTKSKHEALLAAYWPKAAPAFTREYRFDERETPPRKWRFDFAWPAYRVAVELHGGTFAGGRHNTGQGMAKDCEKARAAALQGWHVLPYTDRDLREIPIAEIVAEIRELLVAKGPHYGGTR